MDISDFRPFSLCGFSNIPAKVGNEGDIETFWNNSGFITTTLAKEFSAAVVFAEHRYYGLSLPFGQKSFENDNIRFLSVEQALADYALLILSLKASLGNTQVPVFVMGGSYGGMLAAWFRMKYPDLTNGALASSAPIHFFEGLTSPDTFTSFASLTFASASPTCASRIRSTFSTIQQMGTTPSGLIQLEKAFSLCRPISAVDPLVNFIFYGLTEMAMGDYPYPTTFFGPLPAWPVNTSCAFYSPTTDDISAMVKVMNLFFNSSGNEKCFDLSLYESVSLSHIRYQLNEIAWDYQACTEMVLPISSDGVHDIFPPFQFNLTALSEYCMTKWGVTPRPSWIPTLFGGKLSSTSRIIFSNGLLDPWRTGGVLKTVSPSLVALLIPEGAHHLDLRLPHPADPIYVTQVRKEEIRLLREWLKSE